MTMPHTAYILAAGFGTRLRPLTLTTPKPMVRVWGKPILGHILDRLADAGIKRVIVNTHYLPEQIADFMAQEKRFDVHVRHEKEILETGGALKAALPLIGHDPFFAINGDAFWEDAPGHNLLQALTDIWNSSDMDLLMALYPVKQMVTAGTGDYIPDANGHIMRSADKSGTHMFTGIRICAPQVLQSDRADAFSFLKIMDETLAAGRMRAHVLQGAWYHISTPEDLATIEALKARVDG